MSGANFNITNNKAANEDGSVLPGGGSGSNNSTQLTRVAINHIDLQTNSLTNEQVVKQIPAGHIVIDAYANVIIPFQGTGITDYTISVGIDGETNKYILDTSIIVEKEIIDSSDKGSALTTSGKTNVEDFSNTVELKIFATATGANLDQSTQGIIEVFVLTQPQVELENVISYLAPESVNGDRIIYSDATLTNIITADVGMTMGVTGNTGDPVLNVPHSRVGSALLGIDSSLMGNLGRFEKEVPTATELERWSPRNDDFVLIVQYRHINGVNTFANLAGLRAGQTLLYEMQLFIRSSGSLGFVLGDGANFHLVDTVATGFWEENVDRSVKVVANRLNSIVDIYTDDGNGNWTQLNVTKTGGVDLDAIGDVDLSANTPSDFVDLHGSEFANSSDVRGKFDGIKYFQAFEKGNLNYDLENIP